MSSVAQHSVSIPTGATALQIGSFGTIGGKLGVITLHVAMTAATDFAGKPKAVDPGIFTFQESEDGVTWTTLGTSTTVSGENTIKLIPTKALVKMLGKTTAGHGGTAKVDFHYTGRFGRGQLDFRVYGGKEGYTYAGDTSTDPTGVELGLGTASGNTPATWPPVAPPQP